MFANGAVHLITHTLANLREILYSTPKHSSRSILHIHLNIATVLKVFESIPCVIVPIANDFSNRSSAFRCN